MTKEEIVKKVKRNARRFSMYGRMWASVLELLEQDNDEKAITKQIKKDDKKNFQK